MNTETNLMREECITNVEEFFCNQVINQMEQGNLFNAQSLHEEFVVNGQDVVGSWLFLSDLTEHEV
jgi:hypothetical protein